MDRGFYAAIGTARKGNLACLLDIYPSAVSFSTDRARIVSNVARMTARGRRIFGNHSLRSSGGRHRLRHLFFPLPPLPKRSRLAMSWIRRSSRCRACSCATLIGVLSLLKGSRNCGRATFLTLGLLASGDAIAVCDREYGMFQTDLLKELCRELQRRERWLKGNLN